MISPEELLRLRERCGDIAKYDNNDFPLPACLDTLSEENKSEVMVWVNKMLNAYTFIAVDATASALLSDVNRMQVKLDASRESVYPISVERDEYKTLLREAQDNKSSLANKYYEDTGRLRAEVAKLTEELDKKQSAINNAISNAWSWSSAEKGVLEMVTILKGEVIVVEEAKDINSPDVDLVQVALDDVIKRMGLDYEDAVNHLVDLVNDKHR